MNMRRYTEYNLGSNSPRVGRLICVVNCLGTTQVEIQSHNRVNLISEEIGRSSLPKYMLVPSLFRVWRFLYANPDKVGDCSNFRDSEANLKVIWSPDLYAWLAVQVGRPKVYNLLQVAQNSH